MAGVASVLLVAAGAAWESAALARLGEQPGMVVLKRCVDVDDLMATATTGQADVAVVALDAPGLDAAAVDHLRRHRVHPVAVAAEPGSEAVRARTARIGLPTVVGEDRLVALPDAVRRAADRSAEPTAEHRLPGSTYDVGDDAASSDDLPDGPAAVDCSDALDGCRVIAVWGPAGAPGRTTVALGLGAELARRGTPTLVVDADPFGGSVAQHLGILDEVSGLLSAARLSATGELADRFATVQRVVCDRLHVLTGLPRADRWGEVRPGAVEHILELGRADGHVVVDTGFSLEDDHADLGGRSGRNAMTLGALAMADEIVVVGSADPVGLSRLARGLVELREVTHGLPVRVVVNRMRPSRGWSRNDIAGMVEGFARVAGLHFLPDDPAAVDRALIDGRTLVECGDSALLRAIGEVADAVVPDLAPVVVPAGRRLRRRTAGRAR